MTNKIDEYKAKLLSTDYSKGRNLLSSVLLIIVSTGAVLSWWYVYSVTEEAECHNGFLYLSVLWLISQWVVIGYLLLYPNIPAFARTAITLLILVANVWFGLFIFSLKACVS